MFDDKQKKENVFSDSYLVHLKNYLCATEVPLTDVAIQVKRAPSLKPTLHLSLSWHNISVRLKEKNRKYDLQCWKKNKTQPPANKKLILKNVSGVVRPGELLAIMGASGAGKTTLMNVLTNRSRKQVEIEGEVRVNGRILDKSIARHCSYVQQDDLFIGNLTVREHLTFQAMLRMDSDLTKEERITRLDDVIVELGLKKCENSRIGFPGISGSISGGERKRLAFASEALTNPSIMFCDEPTSGLDSFMAQSVVSVLSKLAAGGRSIVCTIHQPSSEVYAMFHNVLLMAEGRVAYMGSTEGAINFFEKMNLHVPINYNPSDFFIHNLAIIPGNEDDSRKRVNQICDEFAKEKREVPKNGFCPYEEENSQPTQWKESSKYKASSFQQLKTLMWRSALTNARDQKATWARVVLSIVVSTILGAIYWNQQLSQKGIMNINGVIFLSLINMSYTSMMPAVTAISLELPIFLRENKNGMYRTSLYFLCKTIAEIPINFVVPFFFVSITYWMIGLHNFHENYSNYLLYFLIMYLVTNTANSFGCFISCATASVNVGLGVASPIMFSLVAFGGYFVNTGTIKPFISWIKYISWVFYADQALVINQWQGIQNISCPNVDGATCIKNGKFVIQSFNFDEDKFQECLWMILLILVVLRVVSCVVLLLRANKGH